MMNCDWCEILLYAREKTLCPDCDALRMLGKPTWVNSLAAAWRMGLPKRYVIWLVKDGDLVGKKVRGRWLISVVSIGEYKEKKEKVNE